MKTLIILIILTLLHFGYHQTDFCKTKCNLKTNNCCRYRTVAPSCRASFKSIHLSNETLRNFVLKLNVLRNKVAGGLHSQKNLQGVQVANMQLISYSFELQYSSNCWATQCSYYLSRCKAIEDGLVSETIFHRAMKDNEPEDEKVLFDSLDYFFYQAPEDLKVNEYLENNEPIKEILRGPVQYIGCSAVVFTRYETRIAMVVCHYSPAEYKLGAKVFEIGKPCSLCSKGTKCSTQRKFENLCGRVRPMFEDVWYPLVPPINNSFTKERNVIVNGFARFIIILTFMKNL